MAGVRARADLPGRGGDVVPACAVLGACGWHCGRAKLIRGGGQKVDVDKVREIAARYQVSAMPTFICLKGGKKVAEVGVLPPCRRSSTDRDTSDERRQPTWPDQDGRG